HSSPLARVDRASGTNIVDEYLIPWPAPRCRRIVSCARHTSPGTRLNTVPLVSWPLAAPFPAKCAYFECLNLGVQSSPIGLAKFSTSRTRGKALLGFQRY